MDYQLTEVGGAPTYRFAGRWTFKDHGQAAGIAKDVGAMQAGRCVLDLTDLQFIDSAGLGMLLMVKEATKGRDVDIVLRGVADNVRSIMTLAKFDTLFTIEA